MALSHTERLWLLYKTESELKGVFNNSFCISNMVKIRTRVEKTGEHGTRRTHRKHAQTQVSKKMMDRPEIFECKMQLKEYLPSSLDNM